MVLIDTSALSEYFRKYDPEISSLLINRKALIHPFVVGELSLSNSKTAELALIEIADLPVAPMASEEEVRGLVQRYRLKGSGIGWIDAHLLTSSKLAHAKLLTQDMALKQAAAKVLS